MTHWIILGRQMSNIEWDFKGMVECPQPEGSVSRRTEEIRDEYGDGYAEAYQSELAQCSEIKVVEVAVDEEREPVSYREDELW